MAYEFKRLADVEALSEVPEGASVLAEVDGEIKRVPGAGLGGGGGIKTAIIKTDEYANVIAGVSTMVSAPMPVFSCDNMSFDEAYQTILNGEPLVAVLMYINDNGYPVIEQSWPIIILMHEFDVPCIVIGEGLFWTADGLSTELPSGGK